MSPSALLLALCTLLVCALAVPHPHFPKAYAADASFEVVAGNNHYNLTDGFTYIDHYNRRTKVGGRFQSNHTMLVNMDFFNNGTQYIIEDDLCNGMFLQGHFGDPLSLIQYTSYNGTFDFRSPETQRPVLAQRWVYNRGTTEIEIVVYNQHPNVPLMLGLEQNGVYSAVFYSNFRSGVHDSDFALPDICYDDARAARRHAPAADAARALAALARAVL